MILLDFILKFTQRKSTAIIHISRDKSTPPCRKNRTGIFQKEDETSPIVISTVDMEIGLCQACIFWFHVVCILCTQIFVGCFLHIPLLWKRRMMNACVCCLVTLQLPLCHFVCLERKTLVCKAGEEIQQRFLQCQVT